MLTAPGSGPRNFASRLSGRVLLGEADPVDCDVERARRAPHDLGAPAEHFRGVRQGQLAGDARLGVVVAADDEGRDAGLVQPPQLIGEEARRLHRRLVAVVEVARDQERVDLLRKAEVDDRDERPPGRAADELGERRLAQGQRAKGRIEVNVGGMNESERHRGMVDASSLRTKRELEGVHRNRRQKRRPS